MRLLLDTNILLRVGMFPKLLTPSIRKSLLEADELFVSSVSRAEIALKHSIGKLPLPVSEAEFWRNITSRLQAKHLAFNAQHAAHLAMMPLHHRDPFDRMLLAQCLEEGLPFVTTDEALGPYNVPLVL